MRNFGTLLLIGGILGFLYCSQQASKAGTVPEGKSISESLEYDAGKWEVGRYACGAAAVFGLIMTLMPKAR
jgi:hypothetical protein